MIGFVLGTSEGKKFLSLINKYTSDLTVFTATKYGGELLKDFNMKNIFSTPLDKEGFKNQIKKFSIKAMVDASHPYAVNVSKNLIKACKETDIEYIRYERRGIIESLDNKDNISTIEKYGDLKSVLSSFDGNILNTTGSRNIKKIIDLKLENRIVHRILPDGDILKDILTLGVQVEDVIAIKGPVGYELNKAFIKEYDIKAILTKDSGIQGGVVEKIRAAKDTNTKIILIKKPLIDYGKIFFEEINVIEYIKKEYLLKK
ncbi:cobalt-precorrin-6A reductase [Clostridium tarantellae]|uniref:Cobalt-precorrin-6A reductase n=1 Tax=Clostridium tarantellae TaxID=39493 RepID=A0A6I1ML28_9CLOT|nr:cobalt-precorrin-6A reductase [Clostridium tarantellae]MPQ42922.1 cobalt-precorrin-6A reductase [Clostridium tarantellae]